MAALARVPVLLFVLFAEEPQRVQRTYDLDFLTRPVPQLAAGAWPSAGEALLPVWGSAYEPEPVEKGVPISFTAAEEESAPAGRGLSAESIAELIRRNIAEDSWANDLNSIEVGELEITVVQTAPVHEAISKLLEVLRARRALMVAVDIAFVPVDALGPAAATPVPWLPDGELEAALQRAGERGTRLSLTAYNEQRISGSTGKKSTRLADHEVNQTGVIPVVNPVVLRRIPLGITAEALPIAVAGTSLYRLDLRLARLEQAGEATRRTFFFGELEFLPLGEESVETTLLLPAGVTGLAGFCRSQKPLARDFAVLARVRPTEVRREAAAGEPGETFHLRAYDIGFLFEPFAGEESPPDVELFPDLVRAAADPEAWRDDRTHLDLADGGRLLRVTARSATHASVKSFIDSLVRDRARVATCDVRVLEGPLDELLAARRAAEGGILLPADWTPGGRIAETARVLEVGVVGCRMKTRGLVTRAHIADVSTVSGGTGFSVVSMPDPEVRRAADGLQLTALLRSMHAAGRLLADIQLGAVRTEAGDAAHLLLPAAIGRVSTPPGAGSGQGQAGDRAGAAPAPLPSDVWLPFEIDLPRQDYRRCAVKLATPNGRRAILRLEATGDGLGRMVTATVGAETALKEGR